jgi:O-antigen/teichoic acid export membrane protein
MIQRFIGGTLSMGFGNGSMLIFGILGTVLVARILPEADFGAFVILQVASTFLAQITSFGLDVALTRFLTNITDEGEQQRYLGTSVSFRIICIVLASIVALALSSGLVALFGQEINAVLVYLPIMFFLESMSRLLRAVLQGVFKFRLQGLADFVISALNLALIVVFIVWQNGGLRELIDAKLISMAVGLVMVYLALPTRYRPQLHRDTLAKLLRFGFPLQINDVLSFIFTRIDTILIGALLGTVGVAYYEVARRIPDAVGRLFQSFVTVYFPFMSKLSDENPAKAATLLNTSIRLTAFVGFWGALFAVLFGGDLMIWLFSDKYQASIPAFVILVVTMSLGFVSNILGTSLVAIGDTSKPAVINTVHSLISLVSSLILIPIQGITGAALAGLAGNLVSNPLNAYFLLRHRVGLMLQTYIRPLLIFIALAALAVFVTPSGVEWRIILLVSYGVICLLWSVIRIDEIEMAAAWVTARVRGRTRAQMARTRES